MVEVGDLVLAGLFMDGQDFWGIYVFDVRIVVEVEVLINIDLVIKVGMLCMEFWLWYGLVVLMKVNELYEQVAKIDIQ